MTALADVRVLDLTWVIAGPTGTRLLAGWGAEVLKVEWPERIDGVRAQIPAPDGVDVPPGYELEMSGLFNDLNAGKRSITLNMADERAHPLFDELVRRSDVLCENFSAAVMDRWGYGYDALRALNPRLVYLSMSGFGKVGRDRNNVTYGPAAQAMSTLTLGSGLPGEVPAGYGYSYLDQFAGYALALAAVAGLVQRERTGKGQHVDLSQVEVGMSLAGQSLLDFTVNGTPSRRPGFPPGNRSAWPGAPEAHAYRSEPLAAPHGAYRCAGDDENAWCAIAVQSDAQFQRLCVVIERPELADDIRFATVEDRIANQDELDAILEEWTARRDKYEAMAALQRAAIPAGAVQSSRDRVCTDPQLAERGFLRELPHAALGQRLVQQIPVRMSATSPGIASSAPLIGADNAAVFGQLLGLDDERIAALVRDGVLWPRELPRPPWIQALLPAAAEGPA